MQLFMLFVVSETFKHFIKSYKKKMLKNIEFIYVNIIK